LHSRSLYTVSIYFRATTTKSSGWTHVYYATQCPDSVRSVYDIASHCRVLHYAARNHDHILGGAGQLLDDKVDHLAEGGILVLEQLGDAEEEVGGFPGRELLTGEEEKGDLCE
jgi:hypothetical protein